MKVRRRNGGPELMTAPDEDSSTLSRAQVLRGLLEEPGIHVMPCCFDGQ